MTLGGVVLLGLLAVGLVQLAGSSGTPPRASKLTLPEMRARLAGSPAPLGALHAQAGELLPGGLQAIRRRLGELRGHPVVINKWASWCVPCRSEVGAFQRVSVTLGRQVAFIGIDSGDTSRGDALHFLHSYPVSYPSYYDGDGQAGIAITDSTFTPVTVFYDPDGHEYIRQGPYPNATKLEQDVRRYALDG
jgi:thiol-disulfide isomerase/thioredoxin